MMIARNQVESGRTEFCGWEFYKKLEVEKQKSIKAQGKKGIPFFSVSFIEIPWVIGYFLDSFAHDDIYSSYVDL